MGDDLSFRNRLAGCHSGGKHRFCQPAQVVPRAIEPETAIWEIRRGTVAADSPLASDLCLGFCSRSHFRNESAPAGRPRRSPKGSRRPLWGGRRGLCFLSWTVLQEMDWGGQDLGCGYTPGVCVDLSQPMKRVGSPDWSGRRAPPHRSGLNVSIIVPSARRLHTEQWGSLASTRERQKRACRHRVESS